MTQTVEEDLYAAQALIVMILDQVGDVEIPREALEAFDPTDRGYELTENNESKTIMIGARNVESPS